MIEAVVFDLDGVLLDSEQVWDEAREQLARERGGRWHAQAQRDMMGMSSTEWSRYMHETIGLPEPPEEINREVVERLGASYRERLPLLPGAREAVERMAARWPLGLASSSNRELIDLALELPACRASSRRPSRPRRSRAASRRRTSTSRRRAGSASTPPSVRRGRGLAQRHPVREGAGMRVVAIPNAHFPPDEEALAQADVVLDSLDELTPEAVEPG